MRVVAWFGRFRPLRGGQAGPKEAGPKRARPRKAGRWILAAGILAAATVAAGLFWGREGALGRRVEAVTVGFVWPEYPGELHVTDEAVIQPLVQALAQAARQVEASPTRGVPAPRELYWRLELAGGGETRELFATRDFRIYDPAQDVTLESPGLENVLEDLTGRLHDTFFGEPLPWYEALSLFPAGATASVRDLETGLAFQVRRHRGDAHADVEPLTSEDSQTLRTIYGGEWSWKRRAVVATIQERAVAGSINGMPHGWGDLFDNQFEGHFCLHFAGSRVHTTWRVDDGHQLMVLKAAGTLAETLDQAEPEELARWVMAAVNHRERATLRYLADTLDPDLQEALFSQIRTLFVWGTRQVEGDDARARVRVEATLYYTAPDPQTPYRVNPVLEFRRAGEDGPWLLTFSGLGQLVRPVRASVPAGVPAFVDEEAPTLAELVGESCGP